VCVAAVLRGPRDAAHDVHGPAAAARGAGRALLAAAGAAPPPRAARTGPAHPPPSPRGSETLFLIKSLTVVCVTLCSE
jgi:hypothetical protein